MWLAGWTAASIVYRRASHKPVRPTAPPDALYVERRTSGRNLRTLLGRIGGARNCLLVYVTAHDVVVTPHFPFTLMFLPEIYGLELSVPRAQVRLSERRTLVGRKSIIVSRQGEGDLLELRLRDVSGFQNAVQPSV